MPTPSHSGSGEAGTPPRMQLAFSRAEPEDAATVVELRIAAARDLTARFGYGHWSGEASEHAVLNDMRISQIWLARRGRTAVATFRLATRKPWAIDASYFTECTQPLYLTDMAVRPHAQGQGIGRRCVEEMLLIARAWPADAIRLDAYDAGVGAGPFYAKCGFREVGRLSYRGTPLVYYEKMIQAP